MGRVDDSKIRRFAEKSTRRIGDKSPPEAPKSTPNHPRRLQNRPPNRLQSYKKTKNRPRGVPEGQKMRFLNACHAFLVKNVSPRGPNGPRNLPQNRLNRYQVNFFLERVPEAILERFWSENEVKKSQNPSTRRTENENGDFSRIVLPCTREHDY